MSLKYNIQTMELEIGINIFQTDLIIGREKFLLSCKLDGHHDKVSIF
jgi:hypothetical protein